MTHAFAPGHVTGLFAVHDHAEPLRKGSRGAGWSLQKGAWATVQEGDGITINGKPSKAHVTATALQHLGVTCQAHIQLDLPTGQGFGMSAAGTLATCLAATSQFNLEPELALEAAHIAEVQHGTGLGDAIGSWFGSGELRIKPGCPPHGWAMNIPAKGEFLFCTLGEGIPTENIITNPHWQTETRRWGDAAVDRILEAGRDKGWETTLRESQEFTDKLGLLTPQMRELGTHFDHWGQCMLGNTLWVWGAPGDLERAEALLEAHGATFRCGVDPNGARLVRSVPK